MVGEVTPYWRKRINDVLAAPDNEFIPRCDRAGKLTSSYITMHNGVKVYADSYYGGGMFNLLIENRGVHEPQEERAFEEVLNYIPPNATMLELGAYWGFYSLTMLQKYPNARCYLVEPKFENLVAGKLNFKLNKRKGHFTQAYIGKASKADESTISVDAFCGLHQISRLNMLHADIQGFESLMLHGAKKMLEREAIDYIFLSTHSQELHETCRQYLTNQNYQILASADLKETYSFDGLLVAKRKSLIGPRRLIICKKSQVHVSHSQE